MEWYNYLACFFLGVFSINAVPHFLHGISGDSFPTPFARPPGRGNSSPILNLVWGYVNILISFVLFKVSNINLESKWSVALFIIGFLAMSLELCRTLTKK